MSFARPRTHRRDDGVVALEFALLFPLLAMLMMGIVTGGLSYSNAIGVQNAVREGVRFGATADQANAAWTADVISRTRATQFDDGTSQATSETSVCVQLVKAPTTVVKTECSVAANGPVLSMPATSAYPAVPASLTAGTCVVRVLASRPFSINIVLSSLDSTVTRGAVARYERGC